MTLRFPFLAAAVLTILPLEVAAQSSTLTASPGQSVQVGYYSLLRDDCSGGPKPQVRLKTPLDHGQLVVKLATLKTKRLKQCGEVIAPTVVVTYKADSSFVGRIPLAFDVINPETGAAQHVAVDINVEGQRL